MHLLLTASLSRMAATVLLVTLACHGVLLADEKYLYPKMAPHQKALIIPDGSSSAHIAPGSNGSRSGWAVPDMVARAREYFAWAATDTTGKVIGLMPWHWKTVNFTAGDYWDLGIESIPPLRTVWEDVGQKIVAKPRQTVLLERNR